MRGYASPAFTPSARPRCSAKSIRNRPEANARMTKRTLIKEYTFEVGSRGVECQVVLKSNHAHLPSHRRQVELLKSRLAAQIAQSGVYLPAEEFDELQAKLAGLEATVSRGELGEVSLFSPQATP